MLIDFWWKTRKFRLTWQSWVILPWLTDGHPLICHLPSVVWRLLNEYVIFVIDQINSITYNYSLTYILCVTAFWRTFIIIPLLFEKILYQGKLYNQRIQLNIFKYIYTHLHTYLLKYLLSQTDVFIYICLAIQKWVI